jgi:hypothetical protein
LDTVRLLIIWLPLPGPVTKDRVNRLAQLDVLSGKVSVGGDGNKQLSFTSRPDAARYITYVLTHLSPEQLKNRRFAIAGDNKVLFGFYMTRYNGG